MTESAEASRTSGAGPAPGNRISPPNRYLMKVAGLSIVAVAIVAIAIFSTIDRAATPLEATLLSVFLSATSIAIGAVISSHHSEATHAKHHLELVQSAESREKLAIEHRETIALQASAQLFTLMDSISTIESFARLANRTESTPKDLRIAMKQIEPLAANGEKQGENAIQSWRAIAPSIIDLELDKLKAARSPITIDPSNTTPQG